MSDTQRTRIALLALLADNVVGAISPQDLRDFAVTVMEAEFANPGDFWAEPAVANMTADKTVKGWVEYSQMVLSALSFGRVCYLTPSGWAPASALTSVQNATLGVAANSYAVAESQATILRRGLVYDSALSARFSGYVGRLLYLVSGLEGSVSITANTGSNRIVGAVCLSVWSDTKSGHWRFDPTWAVSGV
jgi:hypothetical protein